jgi:hypothetical protein
MIRNSQSGRIQKQKYKIGSITELEAGTQRKYAKKHQHTVRKATEAETQNQVLGQNTVIQSEVKKSRNTQSRRASKWRITVHEETISEQCVL